MSTVSSRATSWRPEFSTTTVYAAKPEKVGARSGYWTLVSAFPSYKCVALGKVVQWPDQPEVHFIDLKIIAVVYAGSAFAYPGLPELGGIVSL